MSDKNLHSEFDDAFRKSFEKGGGAPDPSLWDKIDGQLTAGDDLTFDSNIRQRLQGEPFLPPASLKSVILSKASGEKKPFSVLYRTKWLVVLLALLPIGVALFYYSGNWTTPDPKPNLQQEEFQVGDQNKAAGSQTDTSGAFSYPEKISGSKSTNAVSHKSPLREPPGNSIKASSQEQSITTNDGITGTLLPDNSNGSNLPEPFVGTDTPTTKGPDKRLTSPILLPDDMETPKTTDNDAFTGITDITGQNSPQGTGQRGNSQLANEPPPSLNKPDTLEKQDPTKEDDPGSIALSAPVSTNDSAEGMDQINQNPVSLTSVASESYQRKSTNGNSLSRWSIGLNLYPQFSGSYIKSEEPVIENFYNANLKNRWTFGAEIWAGYKLTDKWSVLTGMGTAGFTSEINLEEHTAEQLENVEMNMANRSITIHSSLRELQITDLGNFNFGKDTSDTAIHHFTYREAQSFQFLQIPLLIQYNINKDKIEWWFAGGTLLSFVTSSQSTLEFYNTSDAGNKILLKDYHETKRVLFGLQARTGVSYSLSRRLSLQAFPVFSYSLSNLNRFKKTDLRPYDLRLSIGLKYQF